MTSLSQHQFPNIEATMPTAGLRSVASAAWTNIKGLRPMDGRTAKGREIQHDTGYTPSTDTELTRDVKVALDPSEPYHLRAHAGDQARKRLEIAKTGDAGEHNKRNI